MLPQPIVALVFTSPTFANVFRELGCLFFFASRLSFGFPLALGYQCLVLVVANARWLKIAFETDSSTSHSVALNLRNSSLVVSLSDWFVFVAGIW